MNNPDFDFSSPTGGPEGPKPPAPPPPPPPSKPNLSRVPLYPDHSCLDHDLIAALRHMTGGTVLGFGMCERASEGGLTWDYTKDGKPFRLVLGYNELGEWLEWWGEKG